MCVCVSFNHRHARCSGLGTRSKLARPDGNRNQPRTSAFVVAIAWSVGGAEPRQVLPSMLVRLSSCMDSNPILKAAKALSICNCILCALASGFFFSQYQRHLAAEQSHLEGSCRFGTDVHFVTQQCSHETHGGRKVEYNSVVAALKWQLHDKNGEKVGSVREALTACPGVYLMYRDGRRIYDGCECKAGDVLCICKAEALQVLRDRGVSTPTWGVHAQPGETVVCSYNPEEPSIVWFRQPSSCGWLFLAVLALPPFILFTLLCFHQCVASYPACVG